MDVKSSILLLWISLVLVAGARAGTRPGTRPGTSASTSANTSAIEDLRKVESCNATVLGFGKSIPVDGPVVDNSNCFVMKKNMQMVLPITPTSVKVFFLIPPEATIHHDVYQVEYKQLDRGEAKLTDVTYCYRRLCRITVNDLTPDTDYRFTVKDVTGPKKELKNVLLAKTKDRAFSYRLEPIQGSCLRLIIHFKKKTDSPFKLRFEVNDNATLPHLYYPISNIRDLTFNRTSVVEDEQVVRTFCNKGEDNFLRPGLEYKFICHAIYRGVYLLNQKRIVPYTEVFTEESDLDRIHLLQPGELAVGPVYHRDQCQIHTLDFTHFTEYQNSDGQVIGFLIEFKTDRETRPYIWELYGDKDYPDLSVDVTTTASKYPEVEFRVRVRYVLDGKEQLSQPSYSQREKIECLKSESRK